MYDIATSSPTRSQFVLQEVQPALLGLMDGSVSSLAPIFTTAGRTGRPLSAFFVGLAASLGARLSMGLSEALSDDGTVTGRGGPVQRGTITGVATAIGGMLHTLPFPLPNLALNGRMSCAKYRYCSRLRDAQACEGQSRGRRNAGGKYCCDPGQAHLTKDDRARHNCRIEFPKCHIADRTAPYRTGAGRTAGPMQREMTMTLNRVERALGMMRAYLAESATFGRGFKQATGMATAPAIMLWSH